MSKLVALCKPSAGPKDRIEVEGASPSGGFFSSKYHNILNIIFSFLYIMQDFNKIAKKWQKKWAEAGIFEVEEKPGKKKF